ncbi:MAG: lecithin--cholesterol acyltransferase, partial [Vicinamibacterales bacterium]
RQTHDWLTRYRASASPNARLILVAHSMGGLISRYFIEVLDGWKDTRALITFGTPYRGSLNAVDALSNGMRKGPRGLIDLSQMGRSFTSMYQLLPIYECYDAGAGALTRVGETTGIPNIDAARAADALKFHNEIRGAVDTHLNQADYLANRYRVHPFVGISQLTSQSAVLRADRTGVDLVPSLNGRDLAGDGTVPRVSATPFEYSKAGLEIFAGTQHGSIQNDESVLLNLRGVITGFSLDLGDFRGRAEQTIGLEVDDLYFDDEPVTVQARLRDADTDEMTATITVVSDAGASAQSRTLRLAAVGDGWYRGDTPPLSPGGYRVRVSLPMAHPAEDTFIVASRDGQ